GRDFDRLMDLLADMLRRPAFPGDDLGRLKGEALALLAQARDDPDSVAERAFERAIYPAGHPLRPVTFEEAEQALGAITRDGVARFYRQHYGPDHLIVVLAGNVPADRVRAAMEARLGSWPGNPQAPVPIPPDVPLQTAAERVTIPMPDK